MARPIRGPQVDGWYHVMGRGLERRELFTDEREREHFLDLLEAVHQSHGLVIHAYVLMDNHYHLVVQTPRANLSAAMQWVNLSYAAWFNRRHGRIGPVFAGRFKAVPVEAGQWVYELSVYVHLNPLRIAALRLSHRDRSAANQGMVAPPGREWVQERLRRLRDYRWSSFRAYAGYAAAPEWLTTEAILARSGGAEQDRQKTYRTYLRQRLAEGGEEATLERLRDGVAIGSARFLAQIKAALGEGPREATGRRARRSLVPFSRIAECVGKLRERPWEELASARGDPALPLAMWAARRYAGLPLRQIGEAVGGKDYAAVSIAIKRLERRMAAEQAVADMARNLSTMLNVET
jgi:REP element-mobilizing transposase RayT